MNTSAIPKSSSTNTLVECGLEPPQPLLGSYKAISPSIVAACNRSADDALRMARCSPVDGRYAVKNKGIAPYVCEAQLARLRIMVEAEWFRNLFLKILPADFAAGEEQLVVELARKMKSFADDLPIESAIEISKQEDRFKHDVIAMITVVRDFLEKEVSTSAGKDKVLRLLSMVHLGLTSEDVSSTSHSLMILSTLRSVIKPACESLVLGLRAKASDFNEVPDPDEPSASLGSRYFAYADRIESLCEPVANPDYLAVKFSGATGTHAAMGVVAHEGLDVLEIAKEFISAIAPELVYLPVTGQINPHDDLALWCRQADKLRVALQEISWEIWEDSGQDVIVGDELVKLLSITPDGDQSGSSAMPQKIQVILVENGIGTAACVGGLVHEFAKTVNVNRLQRELSDSRIIREILGVVLPELLQTFQNIATDIPKLTVNPKCKVPGFGSAVVRRFVKPAHYPDEASAALKILHSIASSFKEASSRLAGVSFLARTHNQPASPTTFGKELRVFAQRLEYLAAVLTKNHFGKPGSYDWKPSDVLEVAHGVLSQFFDDLRIYVLKRNGSVLIAKSPYFSFEANDSAEKNAGIALKDPATLKVLLDSLEINSELANRELNAHYECLGEAVQTVLRRFGVWDAYDRVKKVTRGATMDRRAYQEMVRELLGEAPVSTLVPEPVQQWLIELQPQGFTGAAETLARL